ncbi:MAG: GAF domain-containing protein [Acidobacteria bacterium]|nr:GAF domain-containing protein [Acidobacteriota bacterium]
MAQFNHQKKELMAKLVYYGTALGGKTTNLQYIHRRANPDRKVELFSLNTMQDRTLFFDLLPLSLGKIRGYTLRFQLFTVPGQPQYSATRKVVLAGADAVVFVADSSRQKIGDNVDSLKDFKENLTSNGIDMATIPVIIQYNKRDLPDAVPVDALNQSLNAGGLPFFLSVAIEGKGVVETFMEASKRMIMSIMQRYQMGTEQFVGKNLIGQVEEALRQVLRYTPPTGRLSGADDRTPMRGIPVGRSDRLRTPSGGVPALGSEHPTPARGIPIPPQAGADDSSFRYVVDSKDLLESSVKTSMKLAQLYADVREMKNQLEKRVKELQIQNQLSLAIISTLDLDRVLDLTLNLSMELLGADYGSLSVYSEADATLREVMVRGMEQEKLNIPAKQGELPLAYTIMTKDKPVLATIHEDEELFQRVARHDCNLHAFIAAPLHIKGKPLGLLNLYSTDAERTYGEPELQGLALLANQASIAIENARLYKRLENFNAELEVKVKERTAELEEANRALRKLDEMKSNFLATVSHELRTPLTSIRAFAEILMDDTGDDQQTRHRFLTIIEKETERLTRLIDDILDLSKLEAGKMQWKMKPVKVEDIIQEAMQASSSIADAKKLKMTFNQDGPIPMVVADWDRIFQVVFNLIGNAIKFNKPGGAIDMRVEGYGAEVTISVADSGIGMREEDLTKIFDKFHQVDSSSSREKGGIGLGLAICSEIVRYHGGRIWATSLEGHGSTFYFTVPAHEKAAQPVAEEAHP